MSLWTPNSAKSSEITSAIELHDSDLIAIEDGPYAWAQAQYGKSLNIHQFTEDLKEKFTEIGFGVDVQVWDTNLPGAYRFQVEIQRRLSGEFDPDRQVHEVVNDILHLGTGGWIDTGKAMQEHERRRRDEGHRH